MRNRSLPLVAAALWTLAQVLATCDVLPDDVREVLAVWKNGLGLVFFATAALTGAAAFRPSRLAFVAAAFPLYAASRLWSNALDDMVLVALYAVWWWGFYVVVPGIFLRPVHYRRLVTWIALAACGATAVGVALGVASGEIYWWDHERVVFSFTNPIYLGYAGLTVMVSACFLLGPVNRARRTFWIVLLVAGAAVVLGARARNGLLFGGAFGGAYLLAGRRERLATGTLAALVLLAVVLVLRSQLAGRLDELSSGRLTLWEALVQENMGSLTVGETLFGVGQFEQRMLASHDAVVAGARFSRSHADNAYLDLFLSLGATGVVLFLAPLAAVGAGLLRTMRRLPRGDPAWRDTRVAIATLAGLLAQGIVVSNLPSLGNLMNLLCMSLVTAVAGHVGVLQAGRSRRIRHAAPAGHPAWRPVGA